MAWIYALVGATIAVSIEVLFKLYPSHSYLSFMWATAPAALAVNYCIYKALQTESLIGLLVCFSFGTAIVRGVATLCMGGQVRKQDWIAYGLTMLAALVRVWK